MRRLLQQLWAGDADCEHLAKPERGYGTEPGMECLQELGHAARLSDVRQIAFSREIKTWELNTWMVSGPTVTKIWGAVYVMKIVTCHSVTCDISCA